MISSDLLVYLSAQFFIFLLYVFRAGFSSLSPLSPEEIFQPPCLDQDDEDFEEQLSLVNMSDRDAK